MMLPRLIRWFLRGNDIQFRVGKALVVALGLNLIFGIGFYFVERGIQEGLTLADSIWWAMVTMTTVGYGDFYPKTFVGRYIISYSVFIVGIGFLGYFLGTVAEGMIDKVTKKRRGIMKIKSKNHVIICNCPSTEKVLQLVRELRANNQYSACTYVLVTEKFDELPDEFKETDVIFLKGNPMYEDVLLKANVTECDGVIVLANDPLDPDSDIQTFAIGAIVEMISSEYNRDIKVVTELVSKKNFKMMRRAQTDGIVSTDGITDCLLVQEYLYPGLHEVFQQIITNIEGSQFYIFDTRLDGFKVSDIQVAVLEHPENLQVIGIFKNGHPILNPPKTIKIEAGDRLIMLAESKGDFRSIEEDILKKKIA